MNTPPQSEVIEARLKAVRGRIRGVQRTRGLMVVATVALGGLLILMALDFLFSPLPTALRVTMTALWALAVAAAAKHGFGPLLKPIGLPQVARWLEVRHPEMEERLSTVLEPGSCDAGISPGLMDSLARAAEADLGTVDANVEVRSARTTRVWARPAMGLLGLLALAFAVWPREASRLLVRAVVPFSEKTGNAAAGKFTITPGDIEVVAGDPVKITVAYTGTAKALELWMEMETGTKISQAMTQTGRGNFSYLMDPARAGFRYQVRAGREESDGHTVTVWPLPELLEPRARLEFPHYTGELPRDAEVDNGIEAVLGTSVVLTGRLNTAIASAWLEIDGKNAVEGRIERAASGGRVAFSWTLESSGSGLAVVKLKHRLGRVVDALEFPVRVLEDQPPSVVLLSPVQRDFKVRPDEVLPLKYEITEDFAVAKVAVEVDAGGNAQAMLDQLIPERVARSKPPRFPGKAPVSIGGLVSRFPGISTIRLRIRAEDARPANSGGPGTGYSDWVTLHVDQGAESLARQALREEHEGAKRTIEEAMRAAREGRERMDWQRGEIKKPELGENSRKVLKESAERLAAAEAKLNELARQMKESVHAQKADEVENAAKMAAKAREELENSQLQDDPAQREEKFDQAREDARAAEQQLEQVRNAMDRDRSKVEDLARLMELAQRQQELARQAEANVAKPEAAEKLPEPWKNEQRQVGEQIKQQLRERPEGKAEALKKQAAQATALAEEARGTAKVQQQLEAEAKGDSPESLKQALAAEQAEIAKDAEAALAAARNARSELADTLPEAAQAAATAKEAIEKGDLNAAGDSAKSAAKAMKEAAKASSTDPKTIDQSAAAESLEKLADRQEQVAGALDQLAKGNAAEAMKTMQDAQAAEAANLAGAIERMPQLDGNGAMQEAKNSGKQGSRDAAEAAAKGKAGKPAEAAKEHTDSSGGFEKAAKSLDQAAAEFNQAAQELTSHTPDPQRAAVSPQNLAEAFQQASRAASEPQPAQAASEASAAAKALAAAAESGRQQMQGKGPAAGKPGPPGGPPDGKPGSTPGDKPDAGPRPPEADPGVPPELAKLGISSDDWAKIQASLKSDVGAGDSDSIPEEYRGLVKGYFESMSKKSDKE